MLKPCGRALAALAALTVPAVLAAAPAPATPLDTCDPVGVCTARLVSVTADVVDGTITGTPVGGAHPITLAGQEDAYLKSTGFADPLPQAVREWDEAIDKVSGLDTDPTDPNWYGNAKARVFLPRTLNALATRFPPDTLVVHFVADESRTGTLQLVTIQPAPVDRHLG
ncbi:hypothetical protein [Mycolicibacterium diernhoferi]|uniref:Uncharacterized protein n=1 Tax=Mycolicibacterium diernhoferi TaxID=1801 RepID=A0A1Q4HEZ0_9MYCO|nr:hypothetical protein [Mycolicibacterium diernhoferi]OJZ66119.1 hypothetical protein BRW64_12095 [Mycolicibacterium diernhoferi]OPE50725.1 hypothetical protein BV510_20615 [Mycolicibacterium diernhoferi]